MKLRLSAPGKLIDIGRLPELKYIREDRGDIAIGAGTTHHALATSDLIGRVLPMVSQAAGLIGDVQVRNVGTIGGSIAHADPAADWPAALLAADAVIVMLGPNGKRSVTAEDFFQGFFSTALGENELITEIRLPVPPKNTRSAYAKFMQPASRFAIVGCAVKVTMNGGVCADVRVAFTGVGDHAFRDTGVENVLRGQPATAENIAAAAAHAAANVDPMSDHFASEEYRRHLASVFAKRALMAAVG
jgi:carbon-monoxide dehydrogenase medium subunit